MEITAEVSEISKTVQRDLAFILNVLLELTISFKILETNSSFHEK